jgi:hypothetical protein
MLFFKYFSNAPLSTWDFDNVWEMLSPMDGNRPTLRPAPNQILSGVPQDVTYTINGSEEVIEWDAPAQQGNLPYQDDRYYEVFF